MDKHKPSGCFEMMFMGFDGQPVPAYPRYMYRDGYEPRLINSPEEEKQARKEGWDTITAAAMSNRHLVNWVWDLEDFSPRQLVVFAHDEFGVNLPVDAGQEKLFRAVTELARFAPQNRNRLVLMAHTIAMNYDATLEEIRRMAKGEGQNLVTETESFEVWA